MLQTASQKIIASILVLVVLAGIGYFIFTSVEIPVADVELSEQDVLGQEIIILANKVENISFDQSVFASAVFASLKDYQLPLDPEVQGRNNPFGIIGTEGVPVSNISISSANNTVVTETE